MHTAGTLPARCPLPNPPNLTSPMRTHLSAHLTAEHIDQSVALAGWVLSRRDHGGVIFIDLRDRSGQVQVVANPMPAA